MRKYFIAALIALAMVPSVGTVSAANKIVVGYYYPGSTPAYTYTTIRYDCLTHIAHAFVLANATGSLDVPGGFLYPQLNQRAHERGVKMIITVGGWGNDVPFSKMALDTAARHRFVQNLKNFCITNGYDGADIDWEYPLAGEKANYTALIHELRAAFNSVTPALTLSAALPGGASSGFDLPAIQADFDWIGVMTYDFYGTWTAKAGPNSPLYGTYSTTDQGWIDNAVSYYTGKGVPTAKLLIGIPFYGWSYKTSALYGMQTGGAATQTQAKQMQYRNFIGNLDAGWTRTWDAPTRTPYMTDAAKTTLISYDDSASVAEKCEYIKSKNIAGAIVWAIGQDYTYPRQVLLETIGQRLFNATGVGAQAEAAEAVPSTFSLAQNFPNPFNPSTTIGFTLASRMHIRLSVANVLGQEVAVLADGMMEPGNHAAQWNAKDQPSGVYFYRLAAGAGVNVRAMVLEK